MQTIDLKPLASSLGPTLLFRPVSLCFFFRPRKYYVFEVGGKPLNLEHNFEQFFNHRAKVSGLAPHGLALFCQIGLVYLGWRFYGLI